MSANENEALQKNELLQRLEAISALRKKVYSIKSRMDNFVPEDNYERKVSVPAFSIDDDDVDIDGLLSEINHENDNAIEEMTDLYIEYYHPRKPAEPKIAEFQKPRDYKSEEKQRKLKGWSWGSAAVSVFFILGGLVNLGDEYGSLSTIWWIAAIAAIAFVAFRVLLNRANEEELKKETAARLQYNNEVEKIKTQYAEKLEVYQ